MSLVKAGYNPLYSPGWLVGQLPMGMREDDFFVRFATIFERVAETVRAGADAVEHVADPACTPLPMLAYLGTWMGVDLVDPRLEPEAQREIVRTLGSTLTRRGTAAGLAELLEGLTGSTVRVVDPGAVIADDVVPATHPVEIHLQSCGHLRPQEIEAIIRDEVPAHVAIDILWPDGGDDS
jgi:phage tail-like protein